MTSAKHLTGMRNGMLLRFLVCLFVIMTALGCGGRQMSAPVPSSSGRVVIQFRWPDRSAADSRAIPIGANFVQLKISGKKTDGTTFTLFTETRQRPTEGGLQEIVFPSVPSQNGLTLIASAFDSDPSNFGAREMASASTTLNLNGQAEIHPTLTLSSRVSELTLNRSGVGPVLPSVKQRIRLNEPGEFLINALSDKRELILLDTARELRVTYRGNAIPVLSGGLIQVPADQRTGPNGETLKVQQIGATTADAVDGVSLEVPVEVTARVDLSLAPTIPGSDGGSYLTGSGLTRSLPANRGVAIDGIVSGDRTGSQSPIYTIQKSGSSNNELIKDYLDIANGVQSNIPIDLRTATAISGLYLLPRQRPDGTTSHPFLFGRGTGDASAPILWPGTYTVTATSPDGTDKQVITLTVTASGEVKGSYYVDGVNGNDANSGTSPEQAFQTVAPINALSLKPGQQVLFAGGQTYTGPLNLNTEDSGIDGNPTVISSYGSGRARIDGGTGNAIKLDRCAFVQVRNIDVVGIGRKNGSDGSGILLFQTSDVIVDSIDTRGFRLAGIYAQGGDRIRITHVVAMENGNAGILVRGSEGTQPRGSDIYVGDCIADNNPGDPKKLNNHSGNGILVSDVNGALIEYCEASNNGWDMPNRSNGPVGIWGARCDRMVIQRCISHDNKTTALDGGGFDFDGGMTNSLMQYNLSYNNYGSGYLLIEYPGVTIWQNNTLRYNISMNDGRKGDPVGIAVVDTASRDTLLMLQAQIYNNTIVNTGYAIFHYSPLSEANYRNNLFVGGTDVVHGDFKGATFRYNHYYLTNAKPVFSNTRINGKYFLFKTIADWTTGTGQEMEAGNPTYTFADPLLILPESVAQLPTDPRTLAQMPYFRLRSGSPAVGAGVQIADNGGSDLFGNPIPGNRRPTCGVFEPIR